MGGNFPADSVIGVSLPWLGAQNWKESETELDAQLKAAGFTPMIQAADNKAPQQQQIEAMIQNGAKVLIVGAVDGTQLSSVLEEANAEGIELFGGGPADPNAPDFFNGAMSVLQPKIDDGTLNIVSGQKDFTQAATQDWDNAKAQARMDSILSGFYSDKDIHGVLSPNDGIGRAIITSAKAAGQEIPVVTGLDAENESLVSIWNDEQYATIAKSSADLAARTVELISLLQKGMDLPAPDATTDNGQFEAPIYQLGARECGFPYSRATRVRFHALLLLGRGALCADPSAQVGFSPLAASGWAVRLGGGICLATSRPRQARLSRPSPAGSRDVSVPIRLVANLRLPKIMVDAFSTFSSK